LHADSITLDEVALATGCPSTPKQARTIFKHLDRAGAQKFTKASSHLRPAGVLHVAVGIGSSPRKEPQNTYVLATPLIRGSLPIVAFCETNYFSWYF
jgi:hypothetical protein